MNEKATEGLKRWAKNKKTKTIEEHLEDKDVDDPKALAVWIRKKALGEAEFERHRTGKKK